MSGFVPGKVIKEFQTKKGHTAVLMYPKWESVADMLALINEISKEDTFLSVAGEEFSTKEEAEFMASLFVGMETGDKMYVQCWIDGKLAGGSSIFRKTEAKTRGEHIGQFGLLVAADFRDEGVGFELAKATMEEAIKNLAGLKVITLGCFADNPRALHLYEKLGFKEYGQVPNGIFRKRQNSCVDEVLMAYQV